MELFKKYRELIVYVFFGVLTTAVNYAAYVIAVDWIGLSVSLSTFAAWVLSVAFAYVTNRIWVFASKAQGFRAVSREIIRFVGARIVSLIVDMGIVYLFAEIMGHNDKIVKAMSNVVVVIMNYVFSKLIVFRKK